MMPQTSCSRVRPRRVAHVLRKYNPREWGGTETAVWQLACALRADDVDSVVYAPNLDEPIENHDDPLHKDGFDTQRFSAFLPILGLSASARKTLMSVGGNIVSADIAYRLWRDNPVDLIHTHALNRLGSIARIVAHYQRIPFVVTIHGGYLDLPQSVANRLVAPAERGIDYGKFFSVFLRTRRLIEGADAVIAVNPREAELLRNKYPSLRVECIPHGVPFARYARTHRDAAERFLPIIQGKTVILLVGRIDPVKNQAFLVDCWPRVKQHIANAVLVLVGSATDLDYERALSTRIRALGLENSVFRTGPLSPDDPRLIGLFQSAHAFVLPSSSETFGMVLLEAWAAGCPVISSATSGAKLLVREGENGFLFEAGDAHSFLRAFERTFAHDERRRALGYVGQYMVKTQFDSMTLGQRVSDLYKELCASKRIAKQ
jgi:alpha-maltose-1-phosphate synthase